jgi:hypothetical protein
MIVIFGENQTKTYLACNYIIMKMSRRNIYDIVTNAKTQLLIIYIYMLQRLSNKTKYITKSFFL